MFLHQLSLLLSWIMSADSYRVSASLVVRFCVLCVCVSQEEGFPFRLHGDHNEMQEFIRHSTVEFVKRYIYIYIYTFNRLTRAWWCRGGILNQATMGHTPARTSKFALTIIRANFDVRAGCVRPIVCVSMVVQSYIINF